jgi:hypothetical protein
LAGFFVFCERLEKWLADPPPRRHKKTRDQRVFFILKVQRSAP